MAAPTSFAPGVARDARAWGSHWTEANGRDGSVRSVQSKEHWRLQDAGFAVLVGMYLHAIFRTWEAAPLLFFYMVWKAATRKAFAGEVYEPSGKTRKLSTVCQDHERPPVQLKCSECSYIVTRHLPYIRSCKQFCCGKCYKYSCILTL